MAASVNDYFTKYSNGSQPLPTTLSAQKLAGASTASLTTATGWDTTTVKRVRVYSTTVSGSQTVPDQATICIYDATLSGTTLSNLTLVWSASGSDQTHAAGATVDLAVTASAMDDLATGILVAHNQDGTLRASAVPEIVTGWVTGNLPAVSSVTYNGNRSYDITFASTVASILSPGMRLRTTRTVASPTQCTSLNGSTQYWAKASPTNATTILGTTAYSITTKVKISSYANNHTLFNLGDSVNNGAYFYINTSGQVTSITLQTAAIYRTIQTYQSVPLNKWVDVTLLWSATSTCYILIDGVSVPITTANTGAFTAMTAPTTNLRVGANSGGSFLLGKTQCVAAFNAQITEATARSYMGRAMLGSETNCTFAVNFDGSATDLSANANTLTAVASATATNADSGFGNGATSSTLDYALVQSVSTTVATVQVPEGCTIPTSGGVSTVAYSTQANPYGWPPLGSKIILNARKHTDTTSTAVSTITNVDGLSIAYTAIGTETIRLTFDYYYFTSGAAASTGMAVYIRDGTTTLQSHLFSLVSPNYAQSSPITIDYKPAAGAHTFVVSIWQNAAGTMTLSAANTVPAVLTLEVL